MQGHINCELMFGHGKPSTQTPGIRPGIVSECLIKVYATENIKAGTELLLDYGPRFFE